MRKTRKAYVRPTSEVVELHETNQLLSGSGVVAERSGYGTAVESTWDDEE